MKLCRTSANSKLFSMSTIWYIISFVLMTTVDSLEGSDFDGIRLSGGSLKSEGRMEILQNGTWGTVCGNVTLGGVALVFCRQNGFAGVEAVFRNSLRFGEGNGTVHMISCVGDESNISMCQSITNENKEAACGHEYDAGVMCIDAKHGLLIRIIIDAAVCLSFLVVVGLIVVIVRVSRRRCEDGKQSEELVTGMSHGRLRAIPSLNGGVTPQHDTSYKSFRDSVCFEQVPVLGSSNDEEVPASNGAFKPTSTMTKSDVGFVSKSSSLKSPTGNVIPDVAVESLSPKKSRVHFENSPARIRKPAFSKQTIPEYAAVNPDAKRKSTVADDGGSPVPTKVDRNNPRNTSNDSSWCKSTTLPYSSSTVSDADAKHAKRPVSQAVRVQFESAPTKPPKPVVAPKPKRKPRDAVSTSTSESSSQDGNENVQDTQSRSTVITRATGRLSQISFSRPWSTRYRNSFRKSAVFNPTVEESKE